jgi:hypothetical protein
MRRLRTIAGEHRLPQSTPSVDVAFMKKLIFCCAMLLGAVALDASQPVRVRVTPQIGMAPADVIVYVTVERSPDNRLLRVSAESDGFYRSSEVPLEGEGSARISILHFRELPAGEYDVTADVIGPTGQRRGVAYCMLRVN